MGRSSSHSERGIAPSFLGVVTDEESSKWRESRSWISLLHFSLHSGWMARSMSVQHACLGGLEFIVRQFQLLGLTEDPGVNDTSEKRRHDKLERSD